MCANRGRFLRLLLSPVLLDVAGQLSGMDVADSPGVPASAAAQQLFRGFSFVAPHIEETVNSAKSNESQKKPPLPSQFTGAAMLTNRVSG